MTLFILGYDPILRWIAFRVSPLDGHLFGMCDDLAISVDNILTAWEWVVEIFDLVIQFASLTLNQPKTQILVASPNKFPKTLLDKLIGCNGLNRESITQAMKYLGIFIGPEAKQYQWKKACIGFEESIRFIRGLNLGLIGSISLYNVLAHSKFGYIASFVSPPPCVVRKAKWGQQVITCGPWQAFPSYFLCKLRDLGFSTEVMDLCISSKAARFRNAMQTLTNWNEVVSFHKATKDLDEALVYTEQFPWLKDSCYHTIAEAVNEIQSLKLV